jgi:hypothetical protein
MDARNELRIEADQPVRITVLDESEAEFAGRIVNYSPKGMGLLLDRPIRLEAPVKIVWANQLLLGEVCYCRGEGTAYSAGVSLMHALHNTGELAELARRLLGESSEESRPLNKPTTNSRL